MNANHTSYYSIDCVLCESLCALCGKPRMHFGADSKLKMKEKLRNRIKVLYSN